MTYVLRSAFTGQATQTYHWRDDCPAADRKLNETAILGDSDSAEPAYKRIDLPSSTIQLFGLAPCKKCKDLDSAISSEEALKELRTRARAVVTAWGKSRGIGTAEFDAAVQRLDAWLKEINKRTVETS